MMNKKLHTLFAIACSTVLLSSACTKLPPESYYERGQPESLLDESAEVVNFDLIGPESLDELLVWINEDQPTRAELYCQDGDLLCLESYELLEQFNIPVMYVSSGDNVATLVYERVIARDCENRYIDNSVNPYNLPHPTYGCSVAANMVQMVTDKRQFTSPPLLDYIDGESVSESMRGFRTPRDYRPSLANPNMENQFDIQTDSNGS
jgi:hypothetical protein